VLIGTNNVGKTTILNALQFAMGDGRFSVSQDDFHVQDGIPGKHLVIDLLFLPTDEQGNSAEDFDLSWTAIFGKGIQEGNGHQFFAFRTRVSSEDLDKSFAPTRYILKQWLEWDPTDSWQSTEIEGDSFRISAISRSIPLYFQNAQRDILDDIRQRSSFLGKALSKISYDKDEQQALQELIQELNDKAVQSSPILEALKENLSLLGNTFGSTQGAADITPFSKNIRDLTKSVRLHFNDGVENLSMEYHGMGTRSWASLLVLKAFVQIIAEECKRTTAAFQPILALEEPEAHLHPNAQKQIMEQIQGFPGQIIVSTHSPYVVAQSNLLDCRVLQRIGKTTAVNQIITKWEPEEYRKIYNHVISTHGELLFSRAIVLCEGETEEQLIPKCIEAYTGKPPFEFGISVVGVGGFGNIQTFARIFYELALPMLILADNDGNVKIEIMNHLHKITSDNGNHSIRSIFLDAGNDIEAQLVAEGYQVALKEAIFRHLQPSFSNDRHAEAKRVEIEKLNDYDLLSKLREMKAQYSAKLGDIFIEQDKIQDDNFKLPRHIVELIKQLGLTRRRRLL
jgi:putative ATP-dependent endonuclease of OLD family